MAFRIGSAVTVSDVDNGDWYGTVTDSDSKYVWVQDFSGDVWSANKADVKEVKAGPGRPYVSPLEKGNIVRFKGKCPKEYDSKTLMVVIRTNGRTVSIVKLGGDSGRYFTCSPLLLQKIDPSKIEIAK